MSQPNLATEHPLDIPAFLRVTKADVAHRKASWDAHPPVAMPAFKQANTPERSAIAAEFEAKEAEHARAETARLDALKRKKKDELKGAHTEWHPGCQWDASRSRWVQPGCIKPSKYARLMREMPTDAHREALKAKFGFGQTIVAQVKAAVHKAKAKAAPVVKPKVAKSDTIQKAMAQPKDHKKAAVEPQPAATTPRIDQPIRGGDKHQILMQLLGRPEGATLAEISAATEWQLHTAQARIGGVRKVYDVPLAKEERGTVYRLGANKVMA